MRRAGNILFVAMPFLLAIGTIWAAQQLLQPEDGNWQCAAVMVTPSGEPTCTQWMRQGGGTAMSARPITPVTLAGLEAVRPPENFGPAPDLRWIGIDRLVVDPAYQRDLNRQSARHIRQIVERFDWRLFSAVIVSPIPGGQFAVVDGQHRATAAALCGIDHVPCQVIQADPGMQARAFEAINGKVIQVTKLAQYKAALAAGNEDAIKLRSICSKAGLRMLTSNFGQSCKAGDTMAYNAVAQICSTLAEGVAVYVLRCARATVDTDGVYVRAQTIAAMSAVLTQIRREWQQSPEFLSVAQTINQEQAFSRARQVAAYGSGIKIVDALAAEILSAMEAHTKRKKAAQP